jgi:mRNA interferase MazF
VHRDANRQGKISWAEADDKRRPVLPVTRSDAVPVLTWIVVAPITRTIRQIPTEVAVGPSPRPSGRRVASFDNLQPMRRSFLIERVGRLAAEERGEICRELGALADC